jgi:hypothetical protein
MNKFLKMWNIIDCPAYTYQKTKAVNKIKKNIAIKIILMILTLNIFCSCSKSKFNIGNNINNSIFSRNIICEDKNYVYLTTGLESNIKRIDKKNNSSTDLKYKGYGLNLYNDYLYFQDKKHFYRVDIKNIENTPDLILEYFRGYYLIFNNKIYVEPNINTTIYKMELDGSDKKNYYDLNQDERYFICGADNNYIYVVFIKDAEEVLVNDEAMKAWYLSRMDYKEKKVEKLFPVYFETYADIRFNNFMIILDEYAYCVTNKGISRNKLTLDSEKEIIYDSEFDGIINVVAIVEQGIYFKEKDNDNFLYNISLDGKPIDKIEIDGDELFYVSIYDGKLHYIKNDIIFRL